MLLLEIVHTVTRCVANLTVTLTHVTFFLKMQKERRLLLLAAAIVNLQRSGYSVSELRSSLDNLCRNYAGSFVIHHKVLSGRILQQAYLLMENSS